VKKGHRALPSATGRRVVQQSEKSQKRVHDLQGARADRTNLPLLEMKTIKTVPNPKKRIETIKKENTLALTGHQKRTVGDPPRRMNTPGKEEGKTPVFRGTRPKSGTTKGPPTIGEIYAETCPLLLSRSIEKGESLSENVPSGRKGEKGFIAARASSCKKGACRESHWKGGSSSWGIIIFPEVRCENAGEEAYLSSSGPSTRSENVPELRKQ